MCLSPIHITRSGSRFQKLGLMNDYKVSHSNDGIVAYDVPCGKCEECLQTKKNDIYVRCYHEYNQCNQNALFLTLTYDDLHLPLIEINKQEPIFIPDDCDPRLYECVQEPCYDLIGVWHKPHVQKYLKSLNEKLIYFIGTQLLKLDRLVTINGKRCISAEWKEYLSNSCRPLKYLVVCERGKADIYTDDKGIKRKGTFRPHYHAILFINDPRLYPHINYILTLCKDLWIYGNSYNIRLEPDNITEKRTSSSSLMYVCKYITKDVDNISNTLIYSDYRQENNAKPFVLLSNGIGESLLDNYNNLESVIKDGISVPLGHSIVTYNIPRYNLEKRLKRRIKGIVLKECANIEYKKSVYYDSGHPSPYFFLWEDDYENIKQTLTHVKTIKTHECKELEKTKRHRKAIFYADKLLLYQQSNLVSLWNTSETPLHDRNYSSDIDLLHSISADDLYLFVLNELYIHIDHYSQNDTLYQVYDLVNKINISIRKLDLIKKQIVYKRNLEKSIIAKPSLFNNQPL